MLPEAKSQSWVVTPVHNHSEESSHFHKSENDMLTIPGLKSSRACMKSVLAPLSYELEF